MTRRPWRDAARWTRWKASTAGRRRDKWRIRRRLSAQIVVVAIGVLDLDVSKIRFLLVWHVVKLVNAGGFAFANVCGDIVSREHLLLRWHTKVPYVSAIIRVHIERLAIPKALLGRISVAWSVLKVGLLDVARLKKRMMVVRGLYKGSIVHLTANGRALEVNEPCSSRLIIVGHGEKLTRSGLGAVLELMGKMFSNKI
jgi:hypothetical protein